MEERVEQEREAGKIKVEQGSVDDAEGKGAARARRSSNWQWVQRLIRTYLAIYKTF